MVSGELTYALHPVYTGEWEASKYHGRGRLVWAEGVEQSGEERVERCHPFLKPRASTTASPTHTHIRAHEQTAGELVVQRR